MGVAFLSVGSRVWHDGEMWRVVALAADRATIESAAGARSVSVVELVAAAGTRLLDAPPDEAVPAIGPLLANLTEHERIQLEFRLGHVREVLTGFRSGQSSNPADAEPRPDYQPSRALMHRYRAKAAELGIDPATVRRWAAAYQAEGEAGLVDGRRHRQADPLAGVDGRWRDELDAVLAEHVGASRPPRHLLLEQVNARVEQRYGPGTVVLPSPWKANLVLSEVTRGTNTLRGSTKAKRSIANRPDAPYGRLHATRPGEYLLLDTTRLDVFAMDPLTLRWVNLELTIALDLCSRCIVALRLSPVSTKAVDAALIVYEAICPTSTARTGGGILPYAGVPTLVLVGDGDSAAGLPGVAPETLVVDHGKIYLSEHLLSVCARLGISVQPARPYTPTDKAAVERFFRTVREDLLAALPGYKGPDIYSRGERVEGDAYYFVDELEQIVREWTATCYHRRPHDGLAHPAIPGLELSPLDAFELGVARAGRLMVPARADLAYDFLPVAWRTVQHYGVELHGLRYNDACLNAYSNRRSGEVGANAGKWPIRYDPDDAHRAYFQDPEDRSWHTLTWEHASDIQVPFSAEALAYARRLAAQTDRFPDDRRALGQLLESWDAGLARTPAERRMALRLSQQRADRLDAADTQGDDPLAKLASVQALLDQPDRRQPKPRLVELVGGDDDESEIEAVSPDETPPGDDDYYRDAFGTLQ
jgi:transposase InsO family protein